MQTINPKMVLAGQPFLRAGAVPVGHASQRCLPGAGCVLGDLAVFGWLLLLQPDQSPQLVYKYL